MYPCHGSSREKKGSSKPSEEASNEEAGYDEAVGYSFDGSGMLGYEVAKSEQDDSQLDHC